MWSTAMSVSFPFHQLQAGGCALMAMPRPQLGWPNSRGLHLQPLLPIAMPFRKKYSIGSLSLSPLAIQHLKKITFYHWLVLYFLRFICTITPLHVITCIQYQVSQYTSFKPPHLLWWQSSIICCLLHFDEDAWVGLCYMISNFLLCDRTTGSGSSCRTLTVSTCNIPVFITIKGECWNL